MSSERTRLSPAAAFTLMPADAAVVEKHVATMVGTMMCVRDRDGMRG